MIPADRSTVPWLDSVYAHPYPLKGNKLLGNCPFCMNFIGWVERTVCTDCSRGGRGFGGRATEKRICCQRQCSAFCWYTVVAIRERLNCIKLFSYRLNRTTSRTEGKSRATKGSLFTLDFPSNGTYRLILRREFRYR